MHVEVSRVWSAASDLQSKYTTQHIQHPRRGGVMGVKGGETGCNCNVVV